jgi:response regulator RpfG family c-di-GMP phosphodiesterase
MAEPTVPAPSERGILVAVEDDLNLLQLLEDQLTDHFGATHEVMTFISAEQGLESLHDLSRQGRWIEVVLADLNLPGMQGDRLLEIVQDRFPEALRVLLTEYTDLKSALYAITTARIDRYLRKPWELEDLVLSMASLITQSRLRRENRDLLDELQSRNQELEVALTELAAAKKQSEQEFVLAIQSLAMALEAKDPYTAGHSERVARFAFLVGRRLGLEERELEDLRTVALLHDIGKIGLADSLLNKPGVLNQREFDTIRNHPTIGARILAPISRMAPYILATKHHHERYDGKGYPDGLAGDDLPLPVWIMAVSDAFDAMTSTRPYRKAQPRAFAVDQLRRGRGTQFHPQCVDALLAILREQVEATAETAGP